MVWFQGHLTVILEEIQLACRTNKKRFYLLMPKILISKLEEVFAHSNAQTPTQGYKNHKESGKHSPSKKTNEALHSNPPGNGILWTA